MSISVTDPITPAINRAKLMTFQPFNLGKWFVFGFVAWLASLGEGGASFGGSSSGNTTRPAPPAPMPGPTFPTPGRFPTRFPSANTTNAPLDFFSNIWQWTIANVAMAILLGLLLVILISAIWLVVLWISSRGKFMFLEGIAHNTYEVKAPWAKYRELGNSLFAFRAALVLIGTALWVTVGAFAMFLAWSDIQAKTFGGGALAGVLTSAAVLLPTMIVLSLLMWAVDAFVTTIMYATGQPVMNAWREFRNDVLPGNVSTFALFLLMQIGLGIAVIIATALLGCVTCCIGFLPYLSSVITLPLAIFMRSYSVYFLQQFSPRYMVIEEGPPPGPPPGPHGFPVVQMPPQIPPPLPPT